MNQHAKKIGVATATIIGMNAMIGAGIFTAPAALAVYAGPAGLLAYLFVIIAVWFLAESFGRLAAIFPEGGSFYTYTKQWGGHTLGLISAFGYLIGLLIAMGLLAQIAGIYGQAIIPSSPFTIGLVIILALVALNLAGVALSYLGIFLNALTIFCMTSITLLCLSKASLSNLTPFAPHGLTNIFKATKVAIFGFFGFEAVASLFNEIENPQKNVPRATVLALTLVGILYICFISAVLLAIPTQSFSSDKMPLSEALAILFPGMTWFITVITIAIMSAIIGCIHSIIWSTSDLLLILFGRMKSPAIKNLATQGILNKKAAVLIVGALILLSYSSFNDLSLFFSLTAIFVVFGYVTSIIALLTVKSEWKSGQNYKTIIGLIAAAMIFIFAFQDLIQAVTH
jgi:amino acid efflux transporter